MEQWLFWRLGGNALSLQKYHNLESHLHPFCKGYLLFQEKAQELIESGQFTNDWPSFWEIMLTR